MFPNHPRRYNMLKSNHFTGLRSSKYYYKRPRGGVGIWDGSLGCEFLRGSMCAEEIVCGRRWVWWVLRGSIAVGGTWMSGHVALGGLERRSCSVASLSKKTVVTKFHYLSNGRKLVTCTNPGDLTHRLEWMFEVRMSRLSNPRKGPVSSRVLTAGRDTGHAIG